MKKFNILLLLFVIGFTIQLNAQSSAQKSKDLIHAIVGKWKVIKYQTDAGTQSQADVLVFESDGTFKSDSVYFRTKTGLFRTDENRGVLILENGNTTTEWTTSLKKGVLRMRSAAGTKPSVYITAVRMKEEA